MTTGEVYRLTALVSIRFIERLLALQPAGSLAPAQLFSMSELLDVEGVRLHDGHHNK